MKLLIFLAIIVTILGQTKPLPTVSPSSKSGSSISSINLVDIGGDYGEFKMDFVDLPSNKTDNLTQIIQTMFSRYKLIEYFKTKAEKWNAKLKKDDLPELTDPWMISKNIEITDEMEALADERRTHEIHHNYENINVYGLNDLKEANLKIYTLRNEATLDMHLEQLVINGSYSETDLEFLSRYEMINMYQFTTPYYSNSQSTTRRPPISVSTLQPAVNFEIKLTKVHYHEIVNYSYTPMVEPENDLKIKFTERSKIEYGELETRNLSHNLTYYNRTIIPQISVKIQQAVRNAIFNEIRYIIKKNEIMKNKLENMLHNDMVLVRDHFMQGEDLSKIKSKNDKLEILEEVKSDTEN